jgi:hypothetical protein
MMQNISKGLPEEFSMTIRLYIKDLNPIGVMGQSKPPPLRAKSTGSKQLSDRCTDERVLSYSENEWS